MMSKCNHNFELSNIEYTMEGRIACVVCKKCGEVREQEMDKPKRTSLGRTTDDWETEINK